MRQGPRLPLLLFVGAACAGPSLARSPGSRLRPSEVHERSALPAGHVKGPVLSAECRGQPASADEAPLGDVDCSEARLLRALRAQASELDVDVVVDSRCRARAGAGVAILCSATAARMSDRVARAPAPWPARPAPTPEQVLDLDEPRPLESAEIRVSFRRQGSARSVSPRPYARVAEMAVLPIGRAELGELSARCTGCDEFSLRHALRVTAGSVGATEVIAVRCFQDAAAARCAATAAGPWSF